jgi:hypothetical protein
MLDLKAKWPSYQERNLEARMMLGEIGEQDMAVDQKKDTGALHEDVAVDQKKDTEPSNEEL